MRLPDGRNVAARHKTGAPGRFDRHRLVASPSSGACRRRCRRFGFPVRAGKTPSSNGMPRSRAETWIQARAAPGPERAGRLRRGSPGLDSGPLGRSLFRRCTALSATRSPLWRKRGTRKSRLETKTENEASSALLAETKLVLGNPTKSVDRTLLRNIANALSWLDRIKAGKTYEQIATEDAIPTDRVRKAIRYAFLAPDIVRAIVEGRQPVGLTSSYLLHHPLPDDWEKQRVLVKTL